MATKLSSILIALLSTTTLALTIPPLNSLRPPSAALTTLHLPPSPLPTLPPLSTPSNLTVWPGVPIRVHMDQSIKSEYIDILHYSEKYWEAAFDHSYTLRIQASLVQIWKHLPLTSSPSYRASSGLVSFELRVLEPKEGGNVVMAERNVRGVVYCVWFVQRSFRSPAEVWGVYVKGDVPVARFRVLIKDG